MYVYIEYTDLSNRALMFQMPMATTYLSETTFSALLPLKTKNKNKLDVESKPKADIPSAKHQDFCICFAATSFLLGELQVIQLNIN